MTTTDDVPTAPLDRPPTALDMARAWAGRVTQIATHYEEREAADPGFGRIEAHIQGAGRQQYEAAQMASFMATVSIAEDLHALRRVFLGDADRENALAAKADEAEDGAIADARATREHMASWAAGDEHHRGEEP